MQIMEDALELDHVIFVGESGLDKSVQNDFDEQVRIFKAQAFMAEEYQKPLIIHCVRAYYEILGIHKKNRPAVPWIFHGYSGNHEITKQLLREGVYFSFGAGLFNTESKVADSFQLIPVEKMYFETDELAMDIRDIYEKGAYLKNISTEKLKQLIWENFNRLENVSFNI